MTAQETGYNRIRDLLALITVELNDEYQQPDVQALTDDVWNTRGEDVVFTLLVVTLLTVRSLSRATRQSDSSAWQQLLPDIHNLINRAETS